MDLAAILEQADKDITLAINMGGSSLSDPLWQAFSSRNLSMGFALCSALCIRHIIRRKSRFYTYPIILWALLVGISRIFVGKHFLGDVLVGFFVGALIGSLLAFAAVKVSDRIKPQPSGS